MTLTALDTIEAARRFVACTPMHLTLIDMNRRLLAMSPIAANLLPEEFRDPSSWRGLAEAIPEAASRLADIFVRLAAGEPMACSENEYRLPDGSDRVFRSHASYWRGPDGEPVAVLYVHQDITAELEAEEARRAYEMQLRAVIDNLPVQISLLDIETGEILMMNNQMSHGAASYAGAQLGASVNQTLTPSQRAKLDKIVAETERACGPTETETVFESGPLAGRALRAKHVIFTNERRHRQLLWIAEDVTDLRESAVALKRAAAEAEAANAAKSEFLANMSHEIRTPLNGVMGVASALSRMSLTPPQQEMVSLISTSAKTLETLLSDILDLARIESGKMELQSEPFDLASSVHACSDLFAAAAEAKGLDLVVHIASDAQGAYIGDAARLRQVLCNLVGNAVKFTTSGQVVLSVEARRQEATWALRFQVRDTGPGFDAGTKARLFSRFEQADGSITRRYGGSGLGLAICRSLSEAMGGSLDAEATPGHGAVFTLVLEFPRRELSVVHGDNPAEPEPAHGLDGMRVLLAEDHPTNRRVVELILGAAGVNLTSVENGVEAVNAFRTSTFDLILMDIQMPLMDGLTATRTIRAVEQAEDLPPTPILVLSANAMVEHVNGSLAAGANGHIAKPIDAESLLRQVLDVRPGADAVIWSSPDPWLEAGSARLPN